MELLKNKEFEGFFFDIQKEELSDDGDFVIHMLVTNISDKRKKIIIDVKYCSVEYGYVELNRVEPSDIRYGMYFLPNSFVNAKFSSCLSAINKHIHDGDRMELKINEGKNSICVFG